MRWTVTDAEGRYVPIQHGLRSEPFWVLVACALLNRAGGHQVKPVLERMMARWPTVDDVASADRWQLEEVLRPCGFQAQRAMRVRGMANAYRERPPVTGADVLELPGCGEYAAQSFEVFVLGEFPAEPVDHVLRAWVEAHGPENASRG